MSRMLEWHGFSGSGAKVGDTFECVVIEQTTTSKVLGMNQSGTQKTWCGKGYGSVNMETYNAKGKLVSGNILTGIEGM